MNSDDENFVNGIRPCSLPKEKLEKLLSRITFKRVLVEEEFDTETSRAIAKELQELIAALYQIKADVKSLDSYLLDEYLDCIVDVTEYLHEYILAQFPIRHHCKTHKAVAEYESRKAKAMRKWERFKKRIERRWHSTQPSPTSRG